MVILLLLFLFSFCDGVIYKLSDEEHRRMPRTLRLDPYESCMRDPAAVYCTAYIVFVSDEPNALLTQMQEYSAHTTTHFNYTRAIYGTCLTRECAAFYNKTTHPRHAVEACRNKTVYEEYNLRVIVEDSDDEISCMGAGAGSEYGRKRIGTAHIVVAAACLALVFLNCIGSLVDVCCPKPAPVARFFICFSVPRNWKKLVAKPGAGADRDSRQNSFRSFYGIRAVLGTLVMSAHSMLPIMLLNADTKFFEDEYDTLLLHIMLNGTLIMQIFLQMSALLLVYNGELLSEKHILTWKLLPLAFLKRWLRLTPSYALVLGVTATWLQNIGSGPLWDKLVTMESVDCQRDWWTHLLYINNYFDESHCMPQAWYLATDTQLFCLGIVVYVLCKTPRSRKVVLSLLFIIGFIIPGIHTYYQDLDGALLVSPKAASKFFMSDPTFNHVYKRGHTNVTCYILGMAVGYLTYYLQNINFDVTKYKRWLPLYWTIIPAGTCIIMSCKVFYADAPRVSVYVRVAAACLIKPVFGFICAVGILGMILKYENVYRGVFEWRGWTCLGRVSYSAYLLHVFFIRSTAGLHTRVVHGTYLRMFEMVLFNIVVTYISAYVFWVTVESPLSEVVKCLLDPPPKTKSQAEADAKVEQNEAHSKL